MINKQHIKKNKLAVITLHIFMNNDVIVLKAAKQCCLNKLTLHDIIKLITLNLK